MHLHRNTNEELIMITKDKLNKYYKPEASAIFITSEADVLELFGKMYGYSKLMLRQEQLAPAFFDLSSGLAGAVLQKLVNYKIKTAFIVDMNVIKSEKFKEMAAEANQGQQFRFFASEEGAKEWLVNL